MKKERYKIKLIGEDPMFFELYDNLNKKYFESPNEIVKVLNQQDARIKGLEEALKKANTDNYLTDYYLVEKDNQQLKQQLFDEENAHDLCIDSFNEECENLRKQIKFESEARERFKQSQNYKAIEELERVIDFIRNANKTPQYWDISQFISNKIEDLKGSK